MCLWIIPFVWNTFFFPYLANLYFKVSSNLIYEDSLLLRVLLTAYSSQESYEPLLLLLSRFSRVRLCVTPWTAAHQAPLSIGFSRQEYWSGLPFPSQGDLNPGIKPTSLALLSLAGRFFTDSATWEACAY